jgi:hypothetical protein
MSDLIVKKYVSFWEENIGHPSPDYKVDVSIYLVNSKIRNISKRRQKIALAKKGPSIILKGCYPTIMETARAHSATFTASFNYEIGETNERI